MLLGFRQRSSNPKRQPFCDISLMALANQTHNWSVSSQPREVAFLFPAPDQRNRREFERSSWIKSNGIYQRYASGGSWAADLSLEISNH